MERKNKRTFITLALAACFMLSLSFASVPLYRLFCQVTGFGGTTQTSSAVPFFVSTSERKFTVRFDANTNRNMPWHFAPVSKPMELDAGEQALAFYEARNLADAHVSGTATFNVSPPKAGIYFSKIDCFCFVEQSLAPNEQTDMPVTFYIDPAILEDPEMDDVRTITLSYTFFKIPAHARVSDTNKGG